MDLKFWKPFLFEIMILIGQAYGTNDKMFTKLFDENAYLMGKIITVESRLKTFDDSRMPISAALYYTESAYKRMLIILCDLLIKGNEIAKFKVLMEYQSKFYIFKDLIIKGLESSVRNFRPEMALIISSIWISEEGTHKLIDYSNLMHDLNAKVTLN